MEISLHSTQALLNPAVGYGHAAAAMVESLIKLGHNVYRSNPWKPVQINFTPPTFYKFHQNQYQIGYTPWESTELKDEWVQTFNLCDEVWATSDWVAEVYKNAGIIKPIYVYPHGIEEIWTPIKRVINEDEPIKFLHIGEPATRKDGQLVVDTFAKLFGNNPKYQLTLKCFGSNNTRVKNSRGEIESPDVLYSNIKIITEEYTKEELIQLYHSNHIFVYPTWGEGFGFIPLQALATGMPTICTYDWAQYKKYLGPLKLRSTLTDEKPPRSMGNEHLGKMFKPNGEHLEEQMKYAVDNFKAMSAYYFAQSTKIHEEYNWLQLTKNAFAHLEEKFK